MPKIPIAKAVRRSLEEEYAVEAAKESGKHWYPTQTNWGKSAAGRALTVATAAEKRLVDLAGEMDRAKAVALELPEKRLTEVRNLLQTKRTTFEKADAALQPFFGTTLGKLSLITQDFDDSELKRTFKRALTFAGKPSKLTEAEQKIRAVYDEHMFDYLKRIIGGPTPPPGIPPETWHPTADSTIREFARAINAGQLTLKNLGITPAALSSNDPLWLHYYNRLLEKRKPYEAQVGALRVAKTELETATHDLTVAQADADRRKSEIGARWDRARRRFDAYSDIAKEARVKFVEDYSHRGILNPDTMKWAGEKVVNGVIHMTDIMTARPVVRLVTNGTFFTPVEFHKPVDWAVDHWFRDGVKFGLTEFAIPAAIGATVVGAVASNAIDQENETHDNLMNSFPVNVAARNNTSSQVQRQVAVNQQVVAPDMLYQTFTNQWSYASDDQRPGLVRQYLVNPNANNEMKQIIIGQATKAYGDTVFRNSNGMMNADRLSEMAESQEPSERNEAEKTAESLRVPLLSRTNLLDVVSQFYRP